MAYKARCSNNSDDGVLCHLEEPISVTSRIFKFIDTPVTNALSKLE